MARAYSVNDIVPKYEMLNKIQKAKIKEIIEQNEVEASLDLVKAYCADLKKITILNVRFNQWPNPSLIEVATTNTVHTFKVPQKIKEND
jgi:hypothetical protein